MFVQLLLLLTLIPLVELALLFWVAQVTDWGTTLAIVIITGILGAALARRQGLEVWRRFQDRLRQGKPPTTELLDGLMILLAGVFLITPGILTDVTGILLLTPPVRKLLRGWVARRFVPSGTMQFFSFTSSPFPGKRAGGPNEIEAEYTVEREPAETQDPRLPKSSE